MNGFLRRARATVIAVVALTAMLPAVPAHAAVPNAAVNGFARASAAFIPFNVNPNFDFWPVYSLSETDGSFSHGISAGFWPGFLVDATFFQFGYQPFERALFGAAESAYPITPTEDTASSTDFAEMCAAGEKSTVPLPNDQGDLAAPEPMLTGCQSLYTQYKNRIPYSVSDARTASGELVSDGSATGAELRLGTVVAGSAYASSFTDASKGGKTVSGATVILDDVKITDALRIEQLRSVVRTVADGTVKGAKIERELVVVNARFQGEPVVIGEDGVALPDGTPVDDQLAAYGVDVRLVDGTEARSATEARADSGALVVRMTRDASTVYPGDANATCNEFSGAQPSPVATVSEDLGANPLFEPKPPYDQLPDRIEVNESVLPAIACPLFLMERAVDVGVALGGTTAASRFQPLPPEPTFDFDDDFDFGGDFGGGTAIGGIGGGEFPDGGPLLPRYENTPPVPVDTITGFAEALGADAPSGIKALYGGMVLALALLIAGRQTFR
ncbi:MAG TPA: hypothetical protein VGB64_08360, partial [Actinomycetota bacterium]